MKKRCLVLSVAPVPTDPKKMVEGGGIRAWRLAKGLQANGIDVEVAIPFHFELDKVEHAGIKLSKWEYSEEFKSKMNDFDSVVLLYSRGDLSDYVYKHIDDSVQLIVDLYVPIYIEVAARNSADRINEYHGFQRDIEYWNIALKRGDLFLYANDNQEMYYLGVLSALGRINPLTYYADLLIHLPLGAEVLSTENYQEKIKGKIDGIDATDNVIIWFGSIYPWFEIEQLYQAYKEFSKSNSAYKLVVLGGKNPFNNLPDFVKKYDYIYSASTKDGLINKSIFFVDWVPYEERLDWLQSGDAVIVINKEGIENKVAWRTRTLDLLTTQSIIITNGGDPISEALHKRQAIIKVGGLSQSAINAAFTQLQQLNSVDIARMKSEIKTYSSSLDLAKISSHLAAKIDQHYQAPDLDPSLKAQGITVVVSSTETKARRLQNSIKREGFLRTSKKIFRKVINKLKLQ